MEPLADVSLEQCLALLLRPDKGSPGGWRVLLPEPGEGVGSTPPVEYLAPEVQAGGPETEASDVYALGCMLRVLLGRRGEVLAATFPAADPGRDTDQPLFRDVPDLLGRMLARDPAHRPQLEQVATELSRLLQPAPVTAVPDLPVTEGQRIGNYRLERQLGAGGMGVVFLAVHMRLSRQAAIKVLRPELSQHPEMVARFFTEAEAVNLVQHPGIVSVFEFGQLPDGTVYIVMEYLSGETLQQRLQRTLGRPGVAVLRLLRQVASALAAAHARGIVHRDLKPENVMIVADPDVPGGQRAKLLDFGIAKIAEQMRRSGMDLRQTRSGQAMGTPVYMSPEQCRDAGTVDDRADVYSLGVMLYEVLAGHPPFLAQGFAELASQHFHDTPRPLREIDPLVPDRLVQLVDAMLAKDPAARPPMAHVADELDAVAQSPTAPLAALPSRTAPVRDRSLLRRQLLPLSLGAAVLLTAGGIAGYRHGLHGGRPAPIAMPVPPKEMPPPVVRPAEPPQRPHEESEEARSSLPLLRMRALSVLQEGLHEADPVLRRKALGVLGQSRDARHAGLIEPLLGDGDGTVAAQAALALGQLQARTAVPALLRALKARGRDRQVVIAVSGALAQLGVPAGEAVLRRLTADRSKDPALRRQAVLLLAERRDARARRLLEQEAGLSEDRVAVLGRLARGGDRSAQETLRALLRPQQVDEPQLHVAEALAGSEDEQGRKLLEQAAKNPGPLQLLSARMLASLDDPSYFPLFSRRFADPASPLPDRILAAEGLGACGRPQSAVILGMALPKEGGPLRLRMAAAGAILQIVASDPDLLSQEGLYLAQADLLDPQWPARQEAAAALGDVEPRVAVPLLHRAIRDQQPEVRQTAARALGRTRVRAAVPVLGEALDDRVRGVRREALHSIGAVGQHLRQRGERVDDIVGTVAGRLDRADAQDRVAEVSTLVTLGDKSRRAELHGWLGSRDPEVRRQAVEAWSADPESGQGELVAALSDPVFTVRFTAATRLAQRGLHDGARVLHEALSSQGPDAILATGLLQKLGEPVPAGNDLGEADPAARQQALLAVSRLPREQALSLLQKAARDPVAEVRLKMVEVAGDVPELLGSAQVQQQLHALLLDADQRVRIRAGTLLVRLGRKEGLAPEGPQKPLPASLKQRPAQRRKPAIPPEAPITNEQIRLPPRALDGTVEIKK